MKPTIYIGADHAGFDLKEMIKEHLELTDYTVEDLGAHQFDPNDDYPEYAAAVAQAVVGHAGSFGILSCGNAEGICMAANKFADIRAGIGYSEEAAETMRTDDDANILCIPGRLQTEDDPLGILAAFLSTSFSNAPRHVRRLNKLEELESAISESKRSRASIVPAVLVQSKDAFEEKVLNPQMRKVAPVYQIDVLDGSMFNSMSWADAEQISKIESLPEIELHLMIKDPLPIIEIWKRNIPTLKRVIIHAEIGQDLDLLIRRLKIFEQLEIGVAINPETSIDEIENVADKIKLLLIMGVHPGQSGQEFLGHIIIKKIKQARKKYPHLKIAVDGGVNQKNAKKIIKAGATQLCVSSALWDNPDPSQKYLDFKHI
ncbi:hypothetical protein CO057_01545 [Candidatus Uhrbacteria bacterium CG_4_9_14_0_2_um_filter_41_50]|uniref:Ribulose-phosphate 3-epimerase n=1 Tax=Candidatus Uhrbacteria bacterium CG_4_9_14_0_2_um_filter_41_50 TaxID=1975031 RepID=A0A2M8EPK0_9BACT|nr:MAG: hypothetical protein COZ45_00055 [Candidatus Uhrbacteria bacterium CG_4_10_14_3_um_filter_41_21]PIZ54837.1 MAG: hypothetical protein COY24_02385 [Candidatus Uhrbacteria bacterium CG_4_10_14_0_2_um_filter_41_21]PJB84327.1 MAG: hypothetical protein CO086_04135 [Candidatus Uhrbacteria bacterium CG_4_9_14_0_8_um_filter_41_16]PJC24673.1 MAG: hypothetical protein CO057_01545 [Candidatus Uhrbacteria bacterium CG_4_9_14_0_2_um_filter_41_50]PJE75062.1 MAG: hypothetical protein COV03_02070 [Candi